MTATSQRTAANAANRYAAFISYSHADDTISEWLHEHLEHYAIPPTLQARARHGGVVVGKRIGRIFRDRAEFGARHDLAAEIRSALDGSDSLIVLCSPRSAKSVYVAEEIRYFKSIGRGDRIFAAIISGEPHAGGKPGYSAEDECFPPALIHQLDASGGISSLPETSEPIAADFRDKKDGRQGGALKLIAGLLDIGLDDLVQREKQAERRRRLQANAIAGGMTLLAIVAALGGALAFVNGQKVEKGAKDLQAAYTSLDASKKEVDAKNTELDGKNKTLDTQVRQITKLSTQMSSVVSEIGQIADQDAPDPEKLLFLAYGAPLGFSAAGLNLLFEEEVGPHGNMTVQVTSREVCMGMGYCSNVQFNGFTVDQMRTHWAAYLSSTDIDRIAAVWTKPEDGNRTLGDIVIPRKSAIKVFGRYQLKTYSDSIHELWPISQDLPPDSFGALLSLYINVGRGKFKKIVGDTPADKVANVPEAIIADGMSYGTRLRNEALSRGLLKRRTDEAKLFQSGLDQQAALMRPTNPTGITP